MRTSRALAKQIVATYASVLFDAAEASEDVDNVSTQLDAVARLVRGHAPLRDALRDDSVASTQRAQTARDVFAGLHPALVDTLAVMVERDNFDLLSSVVEEYGRVSEERRGIVAVDVTTAVELTDALRQSITAKLSADLGKGVALREKVDPAIIGGIVISTHGHRIDASIASQLEAARIVLSTAPTGGEA
ncbi:MAG TPA: ATP synthase F1 subunit delta [Coriobacteriia bacterium]